MSEEHNELNDVRAAELAAVREVALSAYPDCVPELVQGETVQALLDSIEPARAAFARVAAAMAEQTEPVVSVPPLTPPAVPAGGGSAVVDPGELPAAEKVRRGIAGRSR